MGGWASLRVGGHLFQRPHPDHRRYLRLRLSAPSDPEPCPAQGWQVVGDDCEESDLCGYLGGCGTASLPSEDILAAIRNYLDLRAAVMARRTPLPRIAAPLPCGRMHRLWRRPPWTSTRHLRCTVPPPPTLPPMQQSGETVQVTLSGDPTGGSPTAGRHRRTRTSVDHTPDPPAADGRLVAGLRRQL